MINTISDGYLSKYSNFSSIELDDEVSFNLNIKSKIAKVINSEINIDDNTFLNGKISKDNFELNIISPLVSSLNFELENIDFSLVCEGLGWQQRLDGRGQGPGLGPPKTQIFKQSGKI